MSANRNGSRTPKPAGRGGLRDLHGDAAMHSDSTPAPTPPDWGRVAGMTDRLLAALAAAQAELKEARRHRLHGGGGGGR